METTDFSTNILDVLILNQVRLLKSLHGETLEQEFYKIIPLNASTKQCYYCQHARHNMCTNPLMPKTNTFPIMNCQLWEPNKEFIMTNYIDYEKEENQ